MGGDRDESEIGLANWLPYRVVNPIILNCHRLPDPTPIRQPKKPQLQASVAASFALT